MADYINKWSVNGVYYNIQDHDRGLPGGVATLDLNGRIPIAQLPETSINYRGTWNALTNTPTLADGTGTQGDMYFVSTSGTWKGEQWYIGDRVIYNGTVWQRVPSSGVNSVNGKDGEVVLYGTDINMSANEATTIEAKINGLNTANPTASGTAEVVVTDITQDKGKISATRKNLPTVDSPTASGNALAFIDAVSQKNGKITATKKNIQDSSTTQKGVVQLTSAYTATDEDKATNGKALAAMLTTLKVDDPEAEGTATEVITSISQTNGKITATKKLLPSGVKVTRTEDTYFGSDWGTDNDRQFAHGTSVVGLNIVSIRVTRAKGSRVTLVVADTYTTVPEVNVSGDFQNKYINFMFWAEVKKDFYVNVHRTYGGTEQFNAYWHHVFVEF